MKNFLEKQRNNAVRTNTNNSSWSCEITFHMIETLNTWQLSGLWTQIANLRMIFLKPNRINRSLLFPVRPYGSKLSRQLYPGPAHNERTKEQVQWKLLGCEKQRHQNIERKNLNKIGLWWNYPYISPKAKNMVKDFSKLLIKTPERSYFVTKLHGLLMVFNIFFFLATYFKNEVSF